MDVKSLIKSGDFVTVDFREEEYSCLAVLVDDVIILTCNTPDNNWFHLEDVDKIKRIVRYDRGFYNLLEGLSGIFFKGDNVSVIYDSAGNYNLPSIDEDQEEYVEI